MFLCLLLTGCGGHKQPRASVPSPPTVTQHQPEPIPPATEVEVIKPKPDDAEVTEEQKLGDNENIPVPSDAKILSTETGLASWYGPPYHNRRGSNGEIYNMHAFTAAHRTLPLGSVVRVTNVKTAHSALVRITDRGPFIEGRIIDLSLAAAKKVDVWQPGVAKVRVEVLETPPRAASGGRWAVQIGGFDKEDSATALADRVARRYHTAKVLKFNSPAGDWWVRVRVLHDERSRAEELAHEISTNKGAIFLVRLD
jgi:rare lipoprotein A